MFDDVTGNLLSFKEDTDRFDVIVQDALADKSVARRSKDRLCDDILAGTHDAYAPMHIPGFGRMPQKAAATAMLNVVDFLFEPLVLSSMQDDALFRYFRSIDQSMLQKGSTASSYGRGLIIETVHHVAIFSVVAHLGQDLARHGGKNRIIVLHQGERPEPRLNQLGAMLRHHYGIQMLLLPFKGKWFKELVKLMTPTTAIVYLADMPATTSGMARTSRSAKIRLTHQGTPEMTGTVQTLSVAAKLSTMLDIDHMIMDFPDQYSFHVMPAELSSGELQCPLEDWVFWPALKSR